jgi:hypothetical protein
MTYYIKVNVKQLGMIVFIEKYIDKPPMLLLA